MMVATWLLVARAVGEGPTYRDWPCPCAVHVRVLPAVALAATCLWLSGWSPPIRNPYNVCMSEHATPLFLLSAGRCGEALCLEGLLARVALVLVEGLVEGR